VAVECFKLQFHRPFLLGYKIGCLTLVFQIKRKIKFFYSFVNRFTDCAEIRFGKLSANTVVQFEFLVILMYNKMKIM
jgi:hypothetical protein